MAVKHSPALDCRWRDQAPGPRPSRGASPLGYAALARLPGLCCNGSAARDMLQGLCCRGYNAGALLHGVCCTGYAAKVMMQGLLCCKGCAARVVLRSRSSAHNAAASYITWLLTAGPLRLRGAVVALMRRRLPLEDLPPPLRDLRLLTSAVPST